MTSLFCLDFRIETIFKQLMKKCSENLFVTILCKDRQHMV